MKTLTLRKQQPKFKAFEVPSIEHYSTLLNASTKIVDEKGNPLIVYISDADDLQDLAIALKGIRYDETARTNGLPTISRVFGHQPRIAIRRDYCTATKLNSEYPYVYEIIKKYGLRASTHYSEHNRQLYYKHMEMTEKVLPDWRMSYKDVQVPFTSGIINKNNQLRYHFDAGNFKNVWSAMYVMKSDVEGGYLSVPEYDIGIELSNNSLLLFDGQSILHGVTPIKMLGINSFRISIVYYSLAGMWKCLEPKEELVRIRRVKTMREENR